MYLYVRIKLFLLYLYQNADLDYEDLYFRFTFKWKSDNTI